VAKPKAQLYVLKIGEFERHELTLSPVDAARAATQIAKGTFDRKKSMWEQPDNARPGRAVKLLDAEGKLLMDCRPGRPSRKAEKEGRSARYPLASCDIVPSFKRKIQKRKRRR
jgi:hypothetical protein